MNLHTHIFSANITIYPKFKLPFSVIKTEYFSFHFSSYTLYVIDIFGKFSDDLCVIVCVKKVIDSKILMYNGNERGKHLIKVF